MKRIIFIISIILVSGHSLSAQSGKHSQLQKFNAFLGNEKALALQEAVDCFEKFLANNFPERKNQTERIVWFLEQIAEHQEADNSWVFDSDCGRNIIESFESTGLRKEIWLFGHEEYISEKDFSEVLPLPSRTDTMNRNHPGELNLDLIEEEIIPIGSIDREDRSGMRKDLEGRIKNSLRPNGEGDYVFALLKYSPQASFVHEYARVFREEFRLSPGVLANGFLNGSPDYEDPLVRRLLVTAFYYPLISFNGKE